MIADFVSLSDSTPQNFRMAFCVFSEHEKCGFDFLLCEQVEQLRCKRGVRAIIECHRDVRTIDVNRTVSDFRAVRRRWRRSRPMSL
jgi:hypothetical protein